MRDNFNYNPIGAVNINCSPVTNITSNGYYGYQPPLEPEKESHDFMEVQVATRKRPNEHPLDASQLKKRRETEKKKSQALLEELLRETHGCSIYHWERLNSGINN